MGAKKQPGDPFEGTLDLSKVDWSRGASLYLPPLRGAALTEDRAREARAVTKARADGDPLLAELISMYFSLSREGVDVRDGVVYRPTAR